MLCYCVRGRLCACHHFVLDLISSGSHPAPNCHFISYKCIPPATPPPKNHVSVPTLGLWPPFSLLFFARPHVSRLFLWIGQALCYEPGTWDRTRSLPLSSSLSCLGRQTYKKSSFLHFLPPRLEHPNPSPPIPIVSLILFNWGGGKHFWLCIWRLSILQE